MRMPKIWHIYTIFTLVTATSLVVSLAVGSSVAWLGGLLIGAGMYVAGMNARSEMTRAYAVSQIQTGKQRAGSTDGSGIDEGEA